MFDDFCTSSAAKESRARFRGSAAAAVFIYGTSGAAIVGASATAHQIVEEKETQVTFAAPPEPAPPPPPPTAETPQPKANLRPRVKRPELAPPDKISDEKLKESDRPLAAADESGPRDGFLDGTPGGTGTGTGVAAPPPPPAPPPPKAEPLVAPVDAGHNEKPRYSAAAKRKGIEGTVVVAFDVLEDGSVANPQILSGPPELHECVLRTVPSWHFSPARRGTERVRFRMKRSIVFRLEDD
jgi:periplasmic protein TonB